MLRKFLKLLALVAAIVASAFGGFGAAALGIERSKASCPGAADDAETRRRHALNEGYSILRRDARTIASVKLLLLVKKETDEFEELVREASKFGADLQDELDRIAETYPAVRTDLDALPLMEKRKRLATGMDRALEIAPLVGLKGADYERTLLISLANGLNQERHLVEEMAKDEPEPGLRKFLADTQTRMSGLHRRAQELLERRHFRRDGRPPPRAATG